MSLDNFEADENNVADPDMDGDELYMKEEFDGTGIERQEDFDDPDKQAETIVTDEPIEELAKKPFAEETDSE